VVRECRRRRSQPHAHPHPRRLAGDRTPGRCVHELLVRSADARTPCLSGSSLSIAACSRHSLPPTHCQEKRQNEAVTRKPLPTFFAGRGAFLGTNRLSLDYSCDQS